MPEGKITEGGIRTNCEVSMLYLQAWLLGNGCVPIHNVMEDLATVEISRSQRIIFSSFVVIFNAGSDILFA